jgi:hypothetical protein
MNPTSETDLDLFFNASSNMSNRNNKLSAEIKNGAGKREFNLAHQETPTTKTSNPSMSPLKRSRASQILRLASSRRNCQSHNHKKSATMGSQIQTQITSYIEEHDLLRKCHEAMTNDYA